MSPRFASDLSAANRPSSCGVKPSPRSFLWAIPPPAIIAIEPRRKPQSNPRPQPVLPATKPSHEPIAASLLPPSLGLQAFHNVNLRALTTKPFRPFHGASAFTAATITLIASRAFVSIGVFIDIAGYATNS